MPELQHATAVARGPTEREADAMWDLMRFAARGEGWVAIRRDPEVAVRALRRAEQHGLSRAEMDVVQDSAHTVAAYHLRRATLAYSAIVERAV